MKWKEWTNRWEATLEAVKKLGGTTNELKVLGKASEDEIKEAESKLGTRLPESLRNTLLSFSESVDFSWRLPEKIQMPEELKEVWAGECRWSLEEVIGVDEGKKDWIRTNFSDKSDPYDKIWHNKLAFFHIANGDSLAIDLIPPKKDSIVYLSHDGAKEHGYILGKDFEDFIDRWTKIGCVGAECWQLAPFLDSPTNGLNTGGKNVALLKQLLKVNF